MLVSQSHHFLDNDRKCGRNVVSHRLFLRFKYLKKTFITTDLITIIKFSRMDKENNGFAHLSTVRSRTKPKITSLKNKHLRSVTILHLSSHLVRSI